MKSILALVCLVSAASAVPLFAGDLMFPIQRGGQPLPAKVKEVFLPEDAQLDKACGRTTLTEADTKIVGGQKASEGQFPYQISLKRSSWGGGFSHSCGGSILDANTILTAAHCADGSSPSSLQVGYGSLQHAKTTGVAVKTIRVNENYNSQTISNDVAILKLASPIPVDNDDPNIGTVALATAGNDPAKGTRVTISGWGTTQSGGSIPADLRYVSVPIVDRPTCNEAYTQYGGVDDSMICAAEQEGGKDSCQGDSGGPLVTVSGNTAVQEGIVSWGYGCAVKGYPGVYARVGYLRKWIDANRN